MSEVDQTRRLLTRLDALAHDHAASTVDGERAEFARFWLTESVGYAAPLLDALTEIENPDTREFLASCIRHLVASAFHLGASAGGDPVPVINCLLEDGALVEKADVARKLVEAKQARAAGARSVWVATSATFHKKLDAAVLRAAEVEGVELKATRKFAETLVESVRAILGCDRGTSASSIEASIRRVLQDLRQPNTPS